jgi:hypothetical protein
MLVRRNKTSAPLTSPFMTETTASFLSGFSRALRGRNAAVFAGAGLSAPAGYVDWRSLLREIAEEVGLDVDKEHDLISVAQFHVNERGGRGKLNQLLLDEFAAKSKRTENHEILARLPIDTFWTTNYDPLIERSLEDAGKKPDVKSTQQSLATTLTDRDVVVYKMHGDVSRADEAVLTKDDYESYNETRQLFTTKLQGDLVSKTFVFIGFSFDDPNLEYIVSRIRILLGKNQRPHYCFFRRPRRSDYEKEEEYQYACVKQTLKINDLRRFAIHSVLVDEYSDITVLLRRVEQRYWRQKLFISGSAAVYGRWTETAALHFVQGLARALTGEFELVTGFGSGIGSAVLNGALEALDAKGIRHLDGHVALRPFPLWAPDPGMLPGMWTQYRERLVSMAGVALFVFGNKNNGDELVLASGMREEFELAVGRGLKVVPIGATGYMARELWEEVIRDFPRFYPGRDDLRAPIEELGRDDLMAEKLISTIVGVVRTIRDS